LQELLKRSHAGTAESDRPPAGGNGTTGEGAGAEVDRTGNEAAVGEDTAAPLDGVEAPTATNKDVSQCPADALEV
jgi:hypothetical protein